MLLKDITKVHLVHFSLPYLAPTDPIDLHLGRKSRTMDFHQYFARYQLLLSAWSTASSRAGTSGSGSGSVSLRAIHLLPDQGRKSYEDMVQAVGRLCVAVHEQKESYLDTDQSFQPQAFKSLMPSVSRLCVGDMHDIQLMSSFKRQLEGLRREGMVTVTVVGEDAVTAVAVVGHQPEDDPFL